MFTFALEPRCSGSEADNAVASSVRSGNWATQERGAALPANRVTPATVAAVMKSADPNDGKTAQRDPLFTRQETGCRSEVARQLRAESVFESGRGPPSAAMVSISSLRFAD